MLSTVLSSLPPEAKPGASQPRQSNGLRGSRGPPTALAVQQGGRRGEQVAPLWPGLA